jgi:uncharacterized membrane protein YdbT with pleckstrin-like domain
MRHSDSGHILLELIVEAEACSAYQVVVGEVSCKSDQATMVVPRVSVCVVGVAAVVFQMVVEAEVVVGLVMERWYNCQRRDQETVELEWLPGQSGLTEMGR